MPQYPQYPQYLIDVRHGKKARERISAVGLAEVMKFAGDSLKKVIERLLRGEIGADGVEMFHGPMVRTAETLTALRLGFPGLGDVIHDPIELFGDSDLFTNMKDSGFLDKLKTEGIAVAAATPDGEGYAELALRGVEQAFDEMKGNVAVAVGHHPMIPLAAIATGYKFTGEFPELSLVVFKKDDDGTISVSEVHISA